MESTTNPTTTSLAQQDDPASRPGVVHAPQDFSGKTTESAQASEQTKAKDTPAPAKQSKAKAKSAPKAGQWQDLPVITKADKPPRSGKAKLCHDKMLTVAGLTKEFHSKQYVYATGANQSGWTQRLAAYYRKEGVKKYSRAQVRYDKNDNAVAWRLTAAG